MKVMMHATGRQLVGYDREDGHIIRRKLYEDVNGNQYVRLGRYASNDPDAHVRRDWFCDHILREGMVER